MTNVYVFFSTVGTKKCTQKWFVHFGWPFWWAPIADNFSHVYILLDPLEGVSFPAVISHKTANKLNLHWIIEYWGGLFVQLLCDPLYIFSVAPMRMNKIKREKKRFSHTSRFTHADHRILDTFVLFYSFGWFNIYNSLLLERMRMCWHHENIIITWLTWHNTKWTDTQQTKQEKKQQFIMGFEKNKREF